MKTKTIFVNVFPTNDRQRNDFDYLKIAQSVVDYSIDLGFTYTLMTVGDKRIDPWVLSQRCMEINSAFSPLIAVNPFYQHPTNIVKKIISLQRLYSAPVALNLVTGSFFGELKAVNDIMDFKERTERLKEFYEAMISIIENHHQGFKGNYYQLNPAEIFPKYQQSPFDLFVSGSMTDEFRTNNSAFFVRSIRPLSMMEKANSEHSGLALGICVRSTKQEAMEAIAKLCPPDRKGEMLFSLALSNNATPWNVWLKQYLEKNRSDEASFYLEPMKNFWGSTPYLVGSYSEVADLMKSYRSLGYDFFILDFAPEESGHVKKCLEIYRSN